MLRRITQRLLRFLATVRLRRLRPEIVAITGSVGKTTTKDAVFTVLFSQYGDCVRRSVGNMNTEEGVPLAILGFESVPSRWGYIGVLLKAVLAAVLGGFKKRTIFVLELAAEKPGDISYLAEIVRPWLKAGIVTTVGPVHLNPGQFDSVAAIEEEKGKLVEVLPVNGWAILNGDNLATKRMAKRTDAKVVWFTDDGVNTYKAIARAVGAIYGMQPAAVNSALKTFHRPYGRLNELVGIKGVTIIDDSYNANPMSMDEALGILAKKQGRKIAVLGDMLELGEQERLYHQQTGKLAKSKADIVVGVGTRARWYGATYHFATPLAAAPFLKKFVSNGDAVLIKGSQSMRMEIVSEALLADPNDSQKLPRQTTAWKSKTFVQP